MFRIIIPLLFVLAMAVPIGSAQAGRIGPATSRDALLALQMHHALVAATLLQAEAGLLSPAEERAAEPAAQKIRLLSQVCLPEPTSDCPQHKAELFE